MDATLWSRFAELQGMMSVFEGCRGRTILPLEILVQRPDGVVDVCLYAWEVPFMPPDWTDLSVFEHPGIMRAVLVPYPQPHFLLQGYVEAIQSCVATFIIHQIDVRMDQFATQQRAVAQQSTPAVPQFYREAHYQTAHSAASASSPSMHHPTMSAHLRTLEEIQHLLHLRASIRHQQATRQSFPPPPPPPPPPSSAAGSAVDQCQECCIAHTPRDLHPQVTSSVQQTAPPLLQNASTYVHERSTRPVRPLPTRSNLAITIPAEEQQRVSSSADAGRRVVVQRRPEHEQF
jgi:hypothetical protein